MHTTYRNANHALPHLLRRVLEQGQLVPSRNGDTRELTMEHFTLGHPEEPYITVPGRNVSLPAQIAETMWILAGRNDVEWLSHYLPRAAEFSDDGKTWRGGYGPRLRDWPNAEESSVDQFAHIIGLLREDPGTRRAVFNIYNPVVDSKPGKDIPCNNWVHFLPRDGELHAHVAIRSNDLFWGWSGINAFEWSNLLSIVAGLTGFSVGTITFSISSLHLYERHWEKADNISGEEGVTRSELEVPAVVGFKPSPTFDPHNLGQGNTYLWVSEFDELVDRWFQLEGQIRKGGLSSALMNQIDSFPEPLFKSWLQALMMWHHNDLGIFPELTGTALYASLERSPKRKSEAVTELARRQREKVEKQSGELITGEQREAFTKFLNELHREKHAAYGDSWKKRGEMLGIMANMARKIDRLGVPGGGDTAADTAIDLFLYAVKYHLWLEEQSHLDWVGLTDGDMHADAVENFLEQFEQQKTFSIAPLEDLIKVLRDDFENLERLVEEKRVDRNVYVVGLASTAYPLALRLWVREEAAKAHVEALRTKQFNGYNID